MIENTVLKECMQASYLHVYYSYTHKHTHSFYLPLSPTLIENAFIFLLSFNPVYCLLEKQQVAQKFYCPPRGYPTNTKLAPRALWPHEHSRTGVLQLTHTAQISPSPLAPTLCLSDKPLALSMTIALQMVYSLAIRSVFQVLMDSIRASLLLKALWYTVC